MVDESLVEESGVVGVYGGSLGIRVSESEFEVLSVIS